MRLAVPASQHSLRLVATLLGVVVVLSLGSLGSREPAGPTYRHYVALGDSFTAAPFVPLTDVAYGCYRSTNSYPRLVARALHIRDLQDRSCTGARTSHLTSTQRTVRGMSVPPQLDALSSETDLVTVGIGANNDSLYARMATMCRRSARVCPLHDQRGTLHAIVDRLRPALVPALEQVSARAPDARVLLVGYPQMLPPRGDCRRLPRMRPQDRATFREINLRLRREMRVAADEAGVEFVDYHAASRGHDVCAAEPWVQGRVGSRRQGAALHPLPAGQRAASRLVVQTLRQQPADPAGHQGHGDRASLDGDR